MVLQGHDISHHSPTNPGSTLWSKSFHVSTLIGSFNLWFHFSLITVWSELWMFIIEKFSMLWSASIFPCARWISGILYKKKKESQLTGRTAWFSCWICLMVIPSTGCCSLHCQEVVEGDIHYDEFDDYVELKGVSGDAVSYPVRDGSYGSKRRKSANLQSEQLGIVTEYA